MWLFSRGYPLQISLKLSFVGFSCELLGCLAIFLENHPGYGNETMASRVDDVRRTLTSFIRIYVYVTLSILYALIYTYIYIYNYIYMYKNIQIYIYTYLCTHVYTHTCGITHLLYCISCTFNRLITPTITQQCIYESTGHERTHFLLTC